MSSSLRALVKPDKPFKPIHEAVMLQIKNDGVAAGYHYNDARMYDYTDHSYAPKLTVGYSVGGGSAPPLAMYLQQRRWR